MRAMMLLVLLATATFFLFGAARGFPAPTTMDLAASAEQGAPDLPRSPSPAIGLAAARVPLDHARSPESASSPDQDSTATLEVSGIVVDEHYRPVPEVSVQLYQPWVSSLRDQREHWVFAETDQDGRFSAKISPPRLASGWITYELRSSEPAYLGMGRHQLGGPMVLTVLSAEHPDRHLTGHVHFVEEWPRAGTLYVLTPSDPLNPLARQTIHGKHCEVDLQGIMFPIRRTTGPVTLAIDGAQGEPQASMRFQSMDQLASALAAGLDVLVRRVAIQLPAYGSNARYRAVSLLRFEHPALGGRVSAVDLDATGTSFEAPLSDGGYRVVATPGESDAKVFGSVEIRNGAASPVEWTHALPGDASIELLLVDPDGEPLVGRNVTYTRCGADGVDMDVSGSKRSDEKGVVRLEGLLRGDYRLWVDFGQRPGENFRREIVTMRAPGTRRITASRSAAVYVVPTIAGMSSHGDFEVALRRNPTSPWRAFTMMPAGPEALVHLAPGLWEARILVPGVAAGSARIHVLDEDTLPGVLASRLEIPCERLETVSLQLQEGLEGPVSYAAELGFSGYSFQPDQHGRVEMLLPSDGATRLSCPSGPLELSDSGLSLRLVRGL